MAILGESFKPYVKKQIDIRQDKLSLGNRDNDTLKYITSKTSFLRLTSGVNISPSVAQNLGVIGLEDNLLAEKYILFSSQFDGRFTSNIGYLEGSFNTSYGFNSDPNYGLVPPPGLTTATINTLNRGTIREATINIVCHNLYQFKIINALFLKLKYSLLLEWGHTLYFNNGTETNVTPSLVDAKYIPNLSKDFLHKKLNVDQLLNEIEKKRNESCGNYDAFFGVIKNFNWELQENGSYNITVNAISQGDVIDSLKVNTNFTPEKTIEGIEPQYQKSTLHKILGDIVTKIKDGPGGPSGTYKNYLHGYKTADNEIALNTANVSNFTGMSPSYKEPLDTDEIGKANAILTNNEGIGITFPGLEIIQNPDGSSTVSPQYYIKLGTLLRVIESFLLYYDLDKKNENGSHPSILYLDHDFDKNECLTTPRHISVDPSTCVIPIDFVNASENTNSSTNIVYFYNLATNTHTIPLNPNGTAQSRTITDSKTEQLSDPPKERGSLVQDFPENIDIVISKESSTGDPLSLIIENKTTLDEAVNAINANAAALATSSGQTITLVTQIVTKITQATVTDESQAGALKYVEKGFRSSDPYIGKTMHIYVNIGKIIEVLNNNIDGNGDVALQNFLKQLLSEISSALCSINNFDLDYDETTNRFSIIDTAVFPLKYKTVNNVAKFNINLLKDSDNGGGSFVTNFGLKSDVFGQISNAIAIGSQTNGNTLGSNSTPISNFNEGLTDRIMTVKGNVNSAKVDPNKGFYQFREAYTRYEQFKVKVTSEDPTVGVTRNDIDLYRSSLVDLMNFDLGVYTNTNNIPGTGFIPLNLQLTMDGLSGIRQYQTFDIDETLLPNEYTNKLKFITTTVTHKIDTKGWETTVNSLGVPKNNKPTVSVDKDIPKIKIEINKTESPTSTSNGSSTSNLYNEAIKYKDYKYELGSNGKEITITRDGSYKGQVFKTFDCSAFVSRVLGKSRMTSEPLVVGGSNFRTLTNNLKASDLKEGDVIGTDNGPTSFDRGRKYGIDHILIVIKNPNSGQLEIWECNGPSISKYNSKNTNSFGGVKYTSLDVKIKKLNQAKNLYVSSYK